MRKPTKQQLKVIRQHAKDTANHFKRDKWNLDAAGLTESLAHDLLGFHVSDELKKQLVRYFKDPVYLKLEQRRLILSLDKGKKKEFALPLHVVFDKQNKDKDKVIVVKLKKKKKRPRSATKPKVK